MPNLNQLTDILSQNFNLNKARTTCLALIIIALINAQSSNLKQIARHFIHGKKSNSNYRRLQRFFAQVNLDYDQLAKLIYRLFDLDKVVISIDRTNWKWGKQNINLFMLSIVYRGIAIPLYWTMLNKRGNSNTLERTELIAKFISTFGKDKIDYVLADREFIGKAWFDWLSQENISFCIRIRKNSLVNDRRGNRVQVHTLFRHLTPQQSIRFSRVVKVEGCRVRLFVKLDAQGEFVIVASNRLYLYKGMSLYAKRWEIETLFSCFKGRGFNLEETHLTDRDRLSKLVAVCVLAFCWAYHVGVVTDSRCAKKRVLKNHGRPQQSLFALGLDVLIDGLRRFVVRREVSIFAVLVSYLTPKPLRLRL